MSQELEPREPVTINNRLMNGLFGYLLELLDIGYFLRVPIPTFASAAPLGDTSAGGAGWAGRGPETSASTSLAIDICPRTWFIRGVGGGLWFTSWG